MHAILSDLLPQYYSELSEGYLFHYFLTIATFFDLTIGTGIRGSEGSCPHTFSSTHNYEFQFLLALMCL